MSKAMILTIPQYRRNIQGSLADLADREIQQKEWANPKYHHAVWSSLMMYVFHDLYDDHGDMADQRVAISKVGEIFFTEEEAIKVSEFCEWFDDLTFVIGEQKPDSAYLEHPDWPRVWSWARECYELMQANDEKYEFKANWHN